MGLNPDEPLTEYRKRLDWLSIVKGMHHLHAIQMYKTFLFRQLAHLRSMFAYPVLRETSSWRKPPEVIFHHTPGRGLFLMTSQFMK